MLYEIFIGLLSIVGLLAGADVIINRARSIAHKLDISDFFIGLTIFSIGTSIPELAMHTITSVDILRGFGDYATLSGLAVGTNIGSNIIQITLITGIVAFFGVLRASKKFLRVDYLVMLASIATVFLFSLNGIISRIEGLVLFLGYGTYIWYLLINEDITNKVLARARQDEKRGKHLYADFMLLVGGIALLLLSADQIANLAEIFSNQHLVSGSLLGTLVIGVSTALPELTTSIFALRSKQSGMSLGTLVGSNITNPTMALGLGAMISSYAVEPTITWFDLPVWFGISTLLLAVIWKPQKLTKSIAVSLLIAYVLFVIIRTGIV